MSFKPYIKYNHNKIEYNLFLICSIINDIIICFDNVSDYCY